MSRKKNVFSLAIGLAIAFPLSSAYAQQQSRPSPFTPAVSQAAVDENNSPNNPVPVQNSVPSGGNQPNNQSPQQPMGGSTAPFPQNPGMQSGVAPGMVMPAAPPAPPAIPPELLEALATPPAPTFAERAVSEGEFMGVVNGRRMYRLEDRFHFESEEDYKKRLASEEKKRKQLEKLKKAMTDSGANLTPSAPQPPMAQPQSTGSPNSTTAPQNQQPPQSVRPQTGGAAPTSPARPVSQPQASPPRPAGPQPANSPRPAAPAGSSQNSFAPAGSPNSNLPRPPQ